MFGLGKKKKLLNIDDIIPAKEIKINLGELEIYSVEELHNYIKQYEDYFSKIQ